MTHKIILFLLIAVGVGDVFGATYKNQNIDGKKFLCSVKTDSGIFPCTVRFEGKTANISLEKRVINVTLESEDIDNPKDVPAFNEKERVTIAVDF